MSQDLALIEAIIEGLNSPVSFVRQKFIKFVTMFVPYLKNFAKTQASYQKEFQTHVLDLIDCFCKLLKKVDVSQFSQNRKILGSAIT